MLDGPRINQVDPSERGLALVFQSYALYPHMTVAENMGFAPAGGRARRPTPPHSSIAMQVDPCHCHLFAADGRALAPLGKIRAA
ncbi:hypothetical protein [Mesorhizobium japonicum]